MRLGVSWSWVADKLLTELSAGVLSGPIATVMNGTLVARPARCVGGDGAPGRSLVSSAVPLKWAGRCRRLSLGLASSLSTKLWDKWKWEGRRADEKEEPG
jgi:hypothetical protein